MVENIKIGHYSAEGFIEEVTKHFNIELEQEERIFCGHLIDKAGKGYFKTFDFDNGITVYEIDCTLTKPVQLTFEQSSVQPLVLLFNREEPIYQYFEDLSEKKTISHLEGVMVSADLKQANNLVLPKEQPTCIFAIVIDRKAFEKKIETFIDEIPDELTDVFRDVNGVNSFFSQGYFSLDVAKYIEEFTTTDLEGFLRHVFLEGKIYEIISHYLKQYLDDLQDPAKQIILRQRTVEKIEKASNIIEQEMDVLGSIMSLAKRVGLNQNTLQEGFNQLYKKSVNNYIKDVRLEKAKELMEVTDLNITEITYRIGINSRSYFSKLFKEKFGLTPTMYLQKARKGKSVQSA